MISSGQRLHTLTSADNGADGVAGRCQGTQSATVVSARGVIEEIQIDDEVVETSTKIGTLRRVERVSAAAVALPPAEPSRRERKIRPRTAELPHVDDCINRRRSSTPISTTSVLSSSPPGTATASALRGRSSSSNTVRGVGQIRQPVRRRGSPAGSRLCEVRTKQVIARPHDLRPTLLGRLSRARRPVVANRAAPARQPQASCRHLHPAVPDGRRSHGAVFGLGSSLADVCRHEELTLLSTDEGKPMASRRRIH